MQERVVPLFSSSRILIWSYYYASTGVVYYLS